MSSGTQEMRILARGTRTFDNDLREEFGVRTQGELISLQRTSL